MPADGRAQVLIAGGGVAALEAALALHHLAGQHAALTIVAPDERFRYRPLSVKEPFALGKPLAVPLREVARDLDATFVTDAVAAVHPGEREVTLAGGRRLGYDALLVAVGARRVPAFDGATCFRGQEDSEPVHGLIQDLEGGYLRRIAFVVPPGVAWPLPLYELALLTAQRAREMSAEAELTVITPEEAPLAVFGPAAADAVGELLRAAGIRVETSAHAEVPDPRTVVIHPGGERLECDRVVALPQVEAIPIDGLPTEAGGFVPADSSGRVRGLDRVYAAGDGTAFPVKQGGLACQQADAAAASIAAAAGAEVTPRRFRPVLRGELVTGSRPLFLRADISGTAGDSSEASGHTLWWPPVKIAGDFLAPYLEAREGGSANGERRHVATAQGLSADGHGIELLGYDVD